MCKRPVPASRLEPAWRGLREARRAQAGTTVRRCMYTKRRRVSQRVSGGNVGALPFSARCEHFSNVCLRPAPPRAACETGKNRTVFWKGACREMRGQKSCREERSLPGRSGPGWWPRCCTGLSRQGRGGPGHRLVRPAAWPVPCSSLPAQGRSPADLGQNLRFPC